MLADVNNQQTYYILEKVMLNPHKKIKMYSLPYAICVSLLFTFGKPLLNNYLHPEQAAARQQVREQEMQAVLHDNLRERIHVIETDRQWNLFKDYMHQISEGVAWGRTCDGWTIEGLLGANQLIANLMHSMILSDDRSKNLINEIVPIENGHPSCSNTFMGELTEAKMSLSLISLNRFRKTGSFTGN